MDVFFTGAKSAFSKALVLIMGLFEGEEFVGRAQAINVQSNNFISKVVSERYFTGKVDEKLAITLPGNLESCPNAHSIVVVGLGKREDFNEAQAKKVGVFLFKSVNKMKFNEAVVLVESDMQHVLAPNIGYGAMLASYNFNKYKTIKKAENENKLKELVFAVDNEEHSSNHFSALKAVAEGVKIARDLSMEPPNVLYPHSYAERIKKLFEGKEIKVEVIDEKSMAKLGLNALLGVGKGSSNPPQLVVMKYSGSRNKEEAPLAFVGKGVTFDSGGVSLKPANGMWDMKYDMSGSAAVVGAMHSLASRGAKVNAVGVVGLAENSISGDAQRPSDIVVSMSKQTIEVLNTDAEGRLVLADALHYTQEKFKPRLIVDLATLTGAIVVALGPHYAGCFSNNHDLALQLLDSGQKVGEKLWRFPLAKEYDKMIDSDVADMKNIALRGSGADSITAAQFLQRFVQPNVSWAHLDIAGVSHDVDDIKGSTGFGVALLDDFAKKYEDTN